jgi:hypothetical protein
VSFRGHCGRDPKLVGFTTTYMQIMPCEFEPRSWRGILDTTLWDMGTVVSSTNKTDRHDITEISLKVALNTIIIKPTNKFVKKNKTNKKQEHINVNNKPRPGFHS